MVLAIVGDYLLGFGTIGTSSDPDAYMGVDGWNVVPDWRYAVSSILGFLRRSHVCLCCPQNFKDNGRRV